MAWESIKNANSLVITSHVHPDGDAVGSSLAFAKYCKDMHKEATVVIDDDIPDIFEYLDGYNGIIRPDQHKNPPDVLVILDTNPNRIGRVSELNVGEVINIDHHGTNPLLCDHHIIRGESSSTAEVLYGLFCMEGYDMKSSVAECLYTGLVTDTLFYKTSGVGVATYLIASELVRCGADPCLIAESLSRKKYNEIVLMSKAVSNTKLYCEGKIAGVCLDESYDELELTDEVIDSIRYIDGIEIAFLLKHERKGGYRVRIRSSKIDVSQIARANGGGGHADAAGFTINDDNAEKAEKILLGELAKWLEQYIG